MMDNMRLERDHSSKRPTCMHIHSGFTRDFEVEFEQRDV